MCGRFACSCTIRRGENVTIRLLEGSPDKANADTGSLNDASSTTTADSKPNNNGAFSLFADCSSFERDWQPSFNVCPTVFAPVLMMNKKNKIQLVPMRYGMLPLWYQGKMEDFKVTTINARSEGIMHKRSYGPPLRNGQRCVIPVDGFFEWTKDQPAKTLKQPYYFYMKQNHDLVNSAAVNSEEEYASKAILMGIAGVYEIWTNPETLEPIKSFSILTVESSKDMNWLHDREPVVLENSDDILHWLDPQFPLEKALKLLKSRDGVLDYHAADRSLVNYPRIYKSIDCIKPHKDESNDKKTNKLGVVPKGQPRIDDFFKQKGTPLKPALKKVEAQPVKINDDDDKNSDYDAGDYGQNADDDEDDDIVEVGRVIKRNVAETFVNNESGGEACSSKVALESEAKKPRNSA